MTRPMSAMIAALAALAALPAGAQSGAGTAGGDWPRPFFERLDANGDGAIDETEIRAMRARAFDRADANGDGVLTEAERSAARERMREAIARRTAAAIRLGGAMAERRGAMAEAADTNRDGVLSRAEVLAAPMPMMARLDRDGDGRVTAAELDAVSR